MTYSSLLVRRPLAVKWRIILRVCLQRGSGLWLAKGVTIPKQEGREAHDSRDNIIIEGTAARRHHPLIIILPPRLACFWTGLIWLGFAFRLSEAVSGCLRSPDRRHSTAVSDLSAFFSPTHHPPFGRGVRGNGGEWSPYRGYEYRPL